MRLIEALEPAPAYVLGPRWEFLAWNAAEARLYPRIAELQAARAQPAVGAVRRSVHTRADRRLGHPRPPGAGRVPRGDDRCTAHDPEFVELVGKLQAESDEFAAWWPEHDVAQFETRLRRFRHPAAGLLTFEYQQLAPVEWPAAGRRPTAVPGDDSAERLAVRHYLV